MLPRPAWVGVAVLAVAGCTQILGVEEGTLDGGGSAGMGGSGGVAMTAGPTTSATTDASTTGTASTTTGTSCSPPDCEDGNDCTVGTCVDGVCQQMNEQMGTPCGVDLVCDGNGNCSGCTNASQCGTDTACATNVCNAGSCSINYQPMGTLAGDPTPHDCLRDECTGSSPDPVAVPFDDPPSMDTEPCANPECTIAGTVFYFPNGNPGSNCTDAQGGGHCERNGNCSSCDVDANCGVSGFGPKCLGGAGAKECGCVNQTDCASNTVAGPYCLSSQCQCATDNDCIGNLRGEDCIGSGCGCNAPGDCVNVPGKPICGQTQVCIPEQI